ncbi:MAG: RHS repeat-associated core domain-containing protein, partial [Abditibacteriaceae bacterium]
VVVPGQSKSTFVYDSDGRKRISTEYTWDATANGGAGDWTQSDETKYVYDGMNLVQEQAADGTVKASYVRDGNIGGVLSMTNADGTFDYHYDGNGNVVALTDSNQNIVAQYSYDAYGNLLSSSGSEADKNPFRFSSKYYDADTGLYDYGFRQYDSSLGRWINRDPMGENGGLNLYGFVGNSPVNDNDAYGLAIVSVHYKLLATIPLSLDTRVKIYHTYILVSNNDGSNPHYVRGGKPVPGDPRATTCPDGSERLVTYYGKYNRNSPDWENKASGPVASLVHDNHSISYWMNKFTPVADRITKAGLPYVYVNWNDKSIGPNSNTSVRYILQQSGLRALPDTWTESDKILGGAPGWSTKFPF